jgi:exodeoxyribonuclease V alpha subunit
VATTLTAEVERITFENDSTSFRVLRVGHVEGLLGWDGPLVLVGTFQAVGPGTKVRATGQLVHDPKRGAQFRADTLVPLDPNTLDGIEKYLGSGVLPGIGPGLAKRIVSTFGLETLTVLDQRPERLTRVSGIGERRVKEIAKAWSGKRAVADVMLLLQTHGASPALAGRIFDQYGDRAASVVQRSPYRLAMDVRGVGFKTADRIAQSLGIAGDHPERAQAGVLHELEQLADSGHVHAPRRLLEERAATMLGIDLSHVEAATDALWAQERVAVEELGGEDRVVVLKRLRDAELGIATGLSRLLESGARPLPGWEAAIDAFQKETGLELAPKQRAAVEACALHRCVVITGGPGVGKTTIVKAVLAVLRRAHLRVALAAPTGRAAKRLSEATAHEASTIHRLLEVDPGTFRFQRNEDRPLEFEALVVDEASMIDAPLAASLVSALPRTARLVVVGDADQLPSVGPGAVLRDLIASGRVPTVQLDEVFRQANESGIVTNAHRIHRGEMPEGAPTPEGDFFIVKRTHAEDAPELIRELVVERMPRRFGLDPLRDVQVLTPMHKGPAGTRALNLALQEALNPTGPSLELRGQRVRVGDKVMQTRNDYEREVFNGDVGRITALDAEERSLSVRFDERDVLYDDAEADALVLAYATSIHKSQGSEYPAVVIPLFTSHFVMLSRNLLYTAVTRAKKLCVLVADPRALSLALAETRKEERMTGLSVRLERELARHGEERPG